MKSATNPSAKEPSIWWKKLGWRKWLLLILFPIPIGPWWTTFIWAVLFCILLWLLIKNSINPSTLPPKPE